MNGAPPSPLRIKRLSLTDFRAFPGPNGTHVDFDGLNLLVYGENGTGKSSLFYALKDFFAFRPERTLEHYRNVFSGAPAAAVCVDVTFTDGHPGANWALQSVVGAAGAPLLRERHPAQALGGSDPRVTQAALRRACLDYRALLDTNYMHRGPVNLFDVAVQHLVADFPVPVAGGTTRTVAELWRAVGAAKPGRQTAAALAAVNTACAEFNAGFNAALTALHPHITTLLSELIGPDVALAPFTFGGVTYNAAHFIRDREIKGQRLVPEVSFRNYQLAAPQGFLNEARLSALALAIYLAGRLACTPTVPTAALKLLVLDDVLIGLDHSNRLPVLDTIRRHFIDWQIVLLTYDRVWFEMARMYLATSNRWKSIEILETDDVTRGILAPTVRGTGKSAGRATLEQARQFLSDHHIPAAANYTRAAFEWALRGWCERHGVPVPFKSDPRHLDTEKLLSSLERSLNEHGSRRLFAGVIERVKLFRKVVLNPYSHASPPAIVRAEVEGAITAVAAMLQAFEPDEADGDSNLTQARKLLTPAAPPPEDLHAALGHVRFAFSAAIRDYCERRHVALPASKALPSTRFLWDAAKAAAAHPVPLAVVAKVEPLHVSLLIDDMTDASLAALTKASIDAAINAVADPADPVRCELESL